MLQGGSARFSEILIPSEVPGISMSSEILTPAVVPSISSGVVLQGAKHLFLVCSARYSELLRPSNVAGIFLLHSRGVHRPLVLENTDQL